MLPLFISYEADNAFNLPHQWYIYSIILIDFFPKDTSLNHKLKIFFNLSLIFFLVIAKIYGKMTCLHCLGFGLNLTDWQYLIDNGKTFEMFYRTITLQVNQQKFIDIRQKLKPQNLHKFIVLYFIITCIKVKTIHQFFSRFRYIVLVVRYYYYF